MDVMVFTSVSSACRCAVDPQTHTHARKGCNNRGARVKWHARSSRLRWLDLRRARGSRFHSITETFMPWYFAFVGVYPWSSESYIHLSNFKSRLISYSPQLGQIAFVFICVKVIHTSILTFITYIITYLSIQFFKFFTHHRWTLTLFEFSICHSICVEIIFEINLFIRDINIFPLVEISFVSTRIKNRISERIFLSIANRLVAY